MFKQSVELPERGKGDFQRTVDFMMDDDEIVLNSEKMGVSMPNIRFIKTESVIGIILRHIEGSSPPD